MADKTKRGSNKFNKDDNYSNKSSLKVVKIPYTTPFDLTCPVNRGMAVFPGDPEVEFYKHKTIQSDGYNVTTIKLGTHTGTHIDAQSHFLADYNTVDEEPLDKFIGEAVLVDLSQKRDIEEGITYQDLDSYSDKVKRNDILLIYTASGDHWLETRVAATFERFRWFTIASSPIRYPVII